MGKPKTMAQLTKLVRERIGPNHFCEALLYPRGVFMGSKFGGAPTCTIRTGNSASARLLMEQHILAVGEMIERSRAEQSSKEFWAAIRKSADLVRGLPAWTQGGIVLSDNFEGGVKAVPCRHCNGTGKEYRWKDGRDGNSK